MVVDTIHLQETADIPLKSDDGGWDPTNIPIQEALIMRQAVREYLRASSKLFALTFQEHAVTEAEREAIVSYAQELAHRFKQSRSQDDQLLLGL